MGRKDFTQLKVALVYDKAVTFGGAERVLLALHELFPQAPLYTSVCNPDKATWTKNFSTVQTSFLQKLPGAKSNPQMYTALMPLAFESFNFKNYDLVISVTSYEAKGIITPPHVLHLCYCLTPNRLLWVDPGYQSFKFSNPLVNFFSHIFKPWLLSKLRQWDLQASTRPDAYISISQLVRNRVRRYYGRESSVIYPPVDSTRFHLAKPQPERTHFLVVSRLVPYKKVDLIIKAFNQLKLPLKIVGTGPQMKFLQQINTNPHTEFLGFIPDSQLLKLYRKARAFIIPQIEDFGIVGLEALACGTPVITNKHSGVAELVNHGTTGILIERQSTKAIIQAIKQFNHYKWDSTQISTSAERYNQTTFHHKFKDYTQKIYSTFHQVETEK